jgi:pSer/pThr/pTyr-binding forkhead associated (FHA) protein
MATHKLIVRYSPSKQEEFKIEQVTLSIGRKPDNDIVIDMPVVSGSHARVLHEGDRIVVEDLNSTNGTFVNKKKISKVALNHKDIIYIGKSQIMYLTDLPSAQPNVADKAKPAEDLDATMVLQTKSHAQMGGAAKKGKSGVGGLSVIEGDTDRTEYALEARLCTIGKVETSTVQIKGMLTPKTAALINRTDTGYIISQPSGGSKVKVNGSGVEGRVSLKDGDIIETYGYKFQFFINK